MHPRESRTPPPKRLFVFFVFLYTKRMRKVFNKKTIIAVFFVILIVFTLNFFQKEVKNFFYLISSPIQKTLFKGGDRLLSFFETITEIKTLKGDVRDLELENLELLAEIVLLRELEKENKVLREALELGLQKDFSLILAQIIGKDISQDYLILNTGAKDGVLKDMPVITGQRILVGRVSEVYSDFSKIMLLSNKKISFDAKISGQDVFGIIKGEGNFRVSLDLVPQEEEIKTGDVLISSALGEVFPKGLLVGKVEKVIKSDLEPFQQADVSLFFNLRGLENIFIISEF